MADNADPTQFDPRAQAMEEVHFDWRCIVCCMVALSPFIWSNSISLALNLFILTLITPHGLNVTSAIPPFICSVGPGNQFMLLDPDIFFVPSFVVGSFRYPYPSLCHLILIDLFSCCLKMKRKVKCPDTLKGTKKPGDWGGSTHWDKNICLFKAEVMQACINEIKRVEGAARLNNETDQNGWQERCSQWGQLLVEPKGEGCLMQVCLKQHSLLI